LTPAARLQAAADILDQLAGTRLTAEAVLKQWGQSNRYAGSKDRRAIADRVYRCLRARTRLLWAMEAPERGSGRVQVLASLSLIDGMSISEIEALFTGEGYGPKPLTQEERSRLEAGAGEAPPWVTSGLPPFIVTNFETQFGDTWGQEAKALMMPRAPIDLRVNGAKATRQAMMERLQEEGLMPQQTPF